MNQISHPLINRQSIKLGLLPRSSLFGTISVVFGNDGWPGKSTSMCTDHFPIDPSHAFRDLEEQPAAERDADGPVDQGKDGLIHQTSLLVSTRTGAVMNPRMTHF
jgi:hypothetical protein